MSYWFSAIGIALIGVVFLIAGGFYEIWIGVGLLVIAVAAAVIELLPDGSPDWNRGMSYAPTMKEKPRD